MDKYENSCQMSQKDIIDEYFMEYRAQLLSIAAFLDRLDRSVDHNAEDDFRLVAFREALEVLTTDQQKRVDAIQLILSDRDTTLLDERDQQSAYGAFNPDTRKEPVKGFSE